MAWELVQRLGARFHDPHGFPQKKPVQCKGDDDFCLTPWNSSKPPMGSIFFNPMKFKATPVGKKKVASLKKTSHLGCFGVSIRTSSGLELPFSFKEKAAEATRNTNV